MTVEIWHKIILLKEGTLITRVLFTYLQRSLSPFNIIFYLKCGLDRQTKSTVVYKTTGKKNQKTI